MSQTLVQAALTEELGGRSRPFEERYVRLELWPEPTRKNVTGEPVPDSAILDIYLAMATQGHIPASKILANLDEMSD